MSRDKAVNQNKEKKNLKFFKKFQKSVDNKLCLWYNDYSKKRNTKTK